MTNQLTAYFSGNQLTDEGLMLYAEAIHLDKVDELPTGFYEKALTCENLEDELIDLVMFIETQDYTQLAPHPFFDTSSVSIGTDSHDLDAILAQLVMESTPVPRYERMINKAVAFRSSNTDKLTVVKPANEELCIDTVAFEFKTDSTKKIVLVIENEACKKVMRPTKIAAQTDTYEVDTTTWESGLYYYKVALEGQKPMMGKFYFYTKTATA